MTRGDRVVVLESGNQGEIVGIEPDGVLLVHRADLEPHFAPSPYDPHELEVCTCNQNGCAFPIWFGPVEPPLCLHERGCPVRAHADRNPPAGCCKESA